MVLLISLRSAIILSCHIEPICEYVAANFAKRLCQQQQSVYIVQIRHLWFCWVIYAPSSRSTHRACKRIMGCSQKWEYGFRMVQHALCTAVELRRSYFSKHDLKNVGIALCLSYFKARRVTSTKFEQRSISLVQPTCKRNGFSISWDNEGANYGAANHIFLVQVFTPHALDKIGR
jgi:hypothetical protein